MKANESVVAGEQAAAALSMLQQAAMLRVLDVAQRLEMPCIFLKGSALAYWLYERPQDRECGDVDVLVPSGEHASRLAQALTRDNAGRAFEPWGSTAHERLVRLFVKPGCMVEIDIHWGVVNSPVFALAFSFEELLQNTRPLRGLVPAAHGLRPAHALIHASLHLAMNRVLGIPDASKWLEDVRRLAECMSPGEVEVFLSVSRAKGFCGLCLDAVQRAQEGLAWECSPQILSGLCEGRVYDRIDPARLGHPLSLFWAEWRAWGRLTNRLRWLLERLFPRLDYLRLLYERPNASRFSLLVQRAVALMRLLLGSKREK